MGIDSATARFLCGARLAGIDFSTTATLGRQAFGPYADELHEIFGALDFDGDPVEFLRTNRFCESFLASLGALRVESFDVSAYENASVIHDMNDPIPSHWHQQFTVVLDSGTLEHVFNIPQALANCMRMVRVGGHFVQVCAANNFCGHGFWQISPELVFRAFASANGFSLRAALMREVVPGGRWYRVSDPDMIKHRVELCNGTPTYLLTIAQRVRDQEIFATVPQQSDYVAAWQTPATPHHEGDDAQAESATVPAKNMGLIASLRYRYRTSIPPRIRRAVRETFQRCFPGTIAFPNRKGFSQPCYSEISEDDVLRGRALFDS